MRKMPNVFAIPAGTPQLETFVTAYLSGTLFGRGPLTPLEIADSRIFVPTRRAAIALTAALSAAASPAASLLEPAAPGAAQQPHDVGGRRHPTQLRHAPNLRPPSWLPVGAGKLRRSLTGAF